MTHVSVLKFYAVKFPQKKRRIKITRKNPIIRKKTVGLSKRNGTCS